MIGTLLHSLYYTSLVCNLPIQSGTPKKPAAQSVHLSPKTFGLQEHIPSIEQMLLVAPLVLQLQYKHICPSPLNPKGSP